MIYNFLMRIPAGLMVVPLLLGCIFKTFFPQALNIGGITSALFSPLGISTLLGLQLFCMGASLQVRDMPKVLKRGGILLSSKVAIGVILGLGIGHYFGPEGVFGLSALAIIAAVSNKNGSVYLTLMNSYGDEADAGCFPILALSDGPFFTLLALGASGFAAVPFDAIMAAIIPVILGMILGNLDEKMKAMFNPMGTAVIPLIGFALGSSIDLMAVIKAGFPGLILGLTTVFIGGAFILFFDKFIGRRPGYAAVAVSTTSGNAVAVPAMVALIDPSWGPYVSSATVQVAASTVITCILAPVLTSWWAKKYGCPKYPRPGQIFN
ncbi:2-keto-3-deoxygluconate permease [Klebsiella quasipneumoniae subsp. similipneumoniae]|uniref:2-keto-3-deoxygluconate permease n=1 Tax=Klebsiella quasipneumoniae TaxID=1463165 RepID=UPI0035A22D1E|nr:2-keto-3-deoxygluconate permease [Klebsiella quasipneumoniae subsp. similipneumoniae]HCF6508386.1 2-keto-3-deoxygluconate permease [Klebsiella quasipneumoniae subsp. similipneumoniae]